MSLQHFGEFVAGIATYVGRSIGRKLPGWKMETEAEVWEWWIRGFERRDRKNPPTKGGIVFVGSSSIARWSTLGEEMAPLPVLNRGFGGSNITDVLYYLDRIVLKHSPRIVVLYAGENDLGSGGSVQGVIEAHQQIDAQLAQALPECKLVVGSVKPSPARWGLRETFHETNRQLSTFVAVDRRRSFVDLATPLLNPTTTLPDPPCYGWDQLHLSAEGYQRWTARLKPLLLNLWNDRLSHDNSGIS